MEGTTATFLANSPRMRQAMTHAPGSAGVYVRVSRRALTYRRYGWIALKKARLDQMFA